MSEPQIVGVNQLRRIKKSYIESFRGLWKAQKVDFIQKMDVKMRGLLNAWGRFNEGLAESLLGKNYLP